MANSRNSKNSSSRNNNRNSSRNNQSSNRNSQNNKNNSNNRNSSRNSSRKKVYDFIYLFLFYKFISFNILLPENGFSILKLSKIVAPTSENVSLSLSLLESLNFGE